MNTDMFERMLSGKGFIAALDQSGGSTPKALKLYGIDESQYKNEAEMFDLIHEMRSRIIQSPVFNSKRILAVILFEMTMNRMIDGVGTAEYLWKQKGIVPFLKVDNGLMPEEDGVQLMRPIPELESRVASGVKHQVFGTKMRSVIKDANPIGIEKIVQQQFDFARKILAGGLIPIIEPEVDIKSMSKEACEELLLDSLTKHLNTLPHNLRVLLKLTIPNKVNLYEPLTKHPSVVRVAALSGGYTRHFAVVELEKHKGLIASFSRALTEGLSVDQSESEFNETLDGAIEMIFKASTEKH